MEKLSIEDLDEAAVKEYVSGIAMIKPSKKNANQVGELLRREFFKMDGGSVSWDPQDDVRVTKDQATEITEWHGEKVVQWQGEKDVELIEANWYWDEDWYLEFHFRNGGMLLNDDAKKDYNWQWFPGSGAAEKHADKSVKDFINWLYKAGYEICKEGDPAERGGSVGELIPAEKSADELITEWRLTSEFFTKRG